MSDANITKLKARVEALGCEILEDDRDVPDRFYVLDHKAGSRLIVISAEVEDVEEWCEEREAGAMAAAQRVAPADDDAERERRGAIETVAYGLCGVITALDDAIPESAGEINRDQLSNIHELMLAAVSLAGGLRDELGGVAS